MRRRRERSPRSAGVSFAGGAGGGEGGDERRRGGERGAAEGDRRPPKRELPPQDRAREICLRALERRMHSRRELELSLARKGIDAGTAAPVLDRLTEVGLVNDEAFARAFVASRQRTRPRGRRALEAELYKKGIAREIADRVLADFAEEEDPVEAARRAVAPKLRSLSGRPAPEARRKAEQFLLRRGFSYSVAREALEGLAQGEDEGGD